MWSTTLEEVRGRLLFGWVNLGRDSIIAGVNEEKHLNIIEPQS